MFLSDLYHDLGLIQTARIIFDFIVLWLVLFFILRAVRFTAALPLFFSASVIALGYWVADILKLRAIVTIFDKSAPLLAIGMVILFQEDIRRLILKANPDTLWRKAWNWLDRGTQGVSRKTEELVNVIVSAARELSSRRIGALIVIDRAADMDAYVNPSNVIRLDAKLTPELLHGIFVHTHGNPLHDGAVVIDPDQNRIVAAAAFLPISINPSIEQSMGTRHRAAIGLSEQTGALVVVVSEETGKITICDDGKYWRFKPTEGDLIRFGDALRKHLTRSVQRDASDRTPPKVEVNA